MARTVVVIGNDGSGKSTYVRKCLAALQRAGIPASRRAYYSSVVRSRMRGAAERLTGASKKKLAAAQSESSGARTQGRASASRPSAAEAPPAPRPRRSRPRAKVLALHIFLWVYQICMAIEARIRDCRADGVVVQDRSFVDDLASILEVFELETPGSLVRFSARAFPLRRVIFLSAGHEIEFGRIVELDLSKGVHRRKGERYREMVRILEEQGVRVRRVSTAPRA